MGNVGAVMRTCVAAGAKLHLIEPLGFHWDSRVIERTSVHLIQQLDYQIYVDFAQFRSVNNHPELIAVECSAATWYSQINFRNYQRVFLLFGQESIGLPQELLREIPVVVRIPMRPQARSLNLATSVAITLFEVCRQFCHPGLT